MAKTPEERLSEIELYDAVAEEMVNGEQVRGLWFKAVADAEGDEEKAKPLYVKYRVQMIKDEITVSERAKTMAIRFGSAQLCNVCNSRVHYFSNDGSGRCWNCAHPSQRILDQR
jgi:hypothetical protein